MPKDILLSGIQPTGDIHIGNYVGAIKNWVNLIDKYDSLFLIVDYHALTVKYDIKDFSNKILDAAIVNIACGIDPNKCKIYIQSDVPEHTELSWILNCVTPIGDLYRMTQFKEKSKKDEENINAGLLTYPVLQAADILIYKAKAVPVGEDQIQHIELTREIARNFNRRFGETFPEPKEIVPKSGARIMGIDGKTKMSKSLGNHIPILASSDVILKKLKVAFTDENRKTLKDPGNPDICNIFTLHKTFTDANTIKEINENCRSAKIGCGQCKEILHKNLMKELLPIQEKAADLRSKPKEVLTILKDHASSARKLAQTTIKEVKEKLGITI